MIARIKENQMFSLPVLDGNAVPIEGLNVARAYVPSIYEGRPGITFKPTGLYYSGDWEFEERIRQQSRPGSREGYAYASGPFEDRKALVNGIVRELRDGNVMGRQIWVSVKPIWTRGEN